MIPPCLQSLWYRILEDEEGIYWLNCNIRFRSNDAWGANFMNMFGFVQFNKEVIAAGVAEKTGRTVKLGRLNWQADSFHIYGKDLKVAKERLFDRMSDMPFEERTMNFNDEFFRENVRSGRTTGDCQNKGLRRKPLVTNVQPLKITVDLLPDVS